MDKEARSHWLMFIAAFALIFTVALLINIYRLLAKDKPPVSAIRVQSNGTTEKLVAYSPNVK